MITKWLNEGRATKEALIKAIRGMKLHRFAENYSDIEYRAWLIFQLLLVGLLGKSILTMVK